MQTSRATVRSDLVVISCNFLSGSQSRGCHVKLQFRNNSILALNIERADGSDSVEKEIIIGGNEILDVFVFDWERDGTIGNLSVRVDICFSDCVTSTGPGLGKGQNILADLKAILL